MDVKKIAVFNPYLQGGHVKTAEIESTQRFINAGKKRGIDIRMFDESCEINNFEPDFVFSITHQIPKLTPFPSYINVNIPVSMIAGVKRFVDNILTYDGYVCVSPSVLNWLDEISKKENKQSLKCEGYFSLEKTPYLRPNLENAFAMYMGTNWDGTRHEKIFNLCGDGKYLKCFGPKHSWEKYPKNLYGGEVPFDGVSVLDYYNKAGAGLCIGHPLFDNEGIANNRIYEISASSALLISSENIFTRAHYGESALYFDHTQDSNVVFEQIKSHIEWVRSNVARAEEMSRASNDIFNKTLSNDYYLDQMLKMHQKVFECKYRSSEECKQKNRVTYLIAKPIMNSSVLDTIHSIKAQEGESSIILVSENQPTSSVASVVDDASVIWIHATPNDSVDKVFQKIKKDKLHPWINALSPGDVLYKNHQSVMMNSFNQMDMKKNKWLKSGVLFAASTGRLIEKQYDEHYFQVKNSTCYDRESVSTCLTSIFFRSDEFSDIFREKTIFNLRVDGLDVSLAYQIREVTCQLEFGGLSDEKSQENINKINELSSSLTLKQNELSAIYGSNTWKLASKIKSIYRRVKLISRFGRLSHES
jgi:hypothetical protein